MAITKMKRVFIAGLADDKEMTLELIRKTGVFHVEPIKKLAGDDESRNAAAVHEMRRAWQTYGSVRKFVGHKKKTCVLITDEEVPSYCEGQLEALREVHNRKASLEKLVKELRSWGDFNPSVLKALEGDGVFVQRFKYDIAGADVQVFPGDIFLQVVARKPELLFFTISTGVPIELPWATPLKHPEKGLFEATEEMRLLTEKEEAIIAELSGMGDRVEVLKGQYLNLLNEANYTEHLGTLYSEGLLFGLQGWLPSDLEEDFMQEASTAELAITLTTRDPAEDETPPVLLKNNWFFKKIEPLIKLYGLPNYRSLDPSYFFAPFMILFFGICLGDAGYGAVFWLASYLIVKRYGDLFENLALVMKLCQLFSVAAIVIGLITGSVFGYNFTSRQWVLVNIHQDHGDPMILFYASLAFGVAHLSFSYILGILQGVSRIDQLRKAGLLGVLWGGALLVSRSIWFPDPSLPLYLPLYYGGLMLLAAGVLINFFFASQDRNWLIRIGLGLYSIYGLTGIVGDLLSYARLFGLGIATTAIASVMNTLAGMVYQAAGPVIGAILSVILLVFGHTFNLVLSILGSAVHSARLHFVETFKSFYRGGGTEYKPFKVERGS